MFLLSNYKKKEQLKISKNNNLDALEANIGELTYKAIECNSPVQFFCLKINKENNIESFNLRDAQPVKYFEIETIYERPETEQENTSNNYLNLIHDFGTKKSKDFLEKDGLKRAHINENISFNIENQLLPVFDKDAHSPKECYSLNAMFDNEILEKFENIEIQKSEMCLFVRTIYNESNRLNMLLLDCFHKFLSERVIYERTLGPYAFYYNELKSHLVRNRLSTLDKDKLIVKFLVMALIACDYELLVDQIPRFNEPLSKITGFLKMVGCNINKNGKAILDRMPTDTFTTKRIRTK